MTVAAIIELTPEPWSAGHARVARAGIEVTVAPMQPEEAGFPVDVWCSRTRPRRTPFADWRTYFAPRARALVAESRVLVASTDHGGQHIALGFLALTTADVVRMIYVKLQFRGMGIGMALLEASGVGVPVKVEEAEPGWKRWAGYHRLPWVVG